MKNIRRYLPNIIISISAILFSACAALKPTQDLSRFYVLSSQTDNMPSIKYDNADLVIMPIVLPAYLDRPQIVQQTSKHELVISVYDRWAEPLDESTTRMVREYLASILGAQHIRQFPYHGDRTNDKKFYLRMMVSSFESDTDNNVTLKSTWRITDYRDVKVFTSGESNIRQKADNGNSFSIAEAMSKAAGNMCIEITEAINGVK